MTVGALVVLPPARLVPRRAAGPPPGRHGALLFGLAIVLSLLTQLIVPFAPGLSLLGLYTVIFTYVVVAVPFVFSGICVTIALTRFPRQLPQPLQGGSPGGGAPAARSSSWHLDITDGPTTVVRIALMRACCRRRVPDRHRDGAAPARRAPLITITLLAAFVAGNSLRIADHEPRCSACMWVKGGREPLRSLEKWNSFSRVTVFRGPHPAVDAQGAGG